MADQLRDELQQACAQIRGLLENLQQLGIRQVARLPRQSELPAVAPAPVAASAAVAADSLAAIEQELTDCGRCSLCTGRSRVVFGVGNPRARLVLVGEAPGREEDRQGIPFVGEAGQLLDRILLAMGLGRDDVYICNVIKCRPPGNRDPKPEEIAACEPFLQRQLAAIAPELIVTLGKFAAQTLLRDQSPISRLRGQCREYQGIPLMPTYHPAFLLRNPSAKREVWDDMKAVLLRLRQGT